MSRRWRLGWHDLSRSAGHFSAPDSWQEVRHQADSAEIHIADVKTDQGCVLEFQHSPIKPEERRAQDAFYKKLVWIVDATKRKRDRIKFQNLLKEGVLVYEKTPVLKLRGSLGECALLRDWADNPTPVFFDFGEESTLWYLLPQASPTIAYVVKFSREYFIQLHRDGMPMAQQFDFWFTELGRLISNYESNLRGQASRQPRLQVRSGRRYPPQTFLPHSSGRARLKNRL